MTSDMTSDCLNHQALAKARQMEQQMTSDMTSDDL